MEEVDVNKMADVIRESAFYAHKYFKNGFLEKIYENSLKNRLLKLGLRGRSYRGGCDDFRALSREISF